MKEVSSEVIKWGADAEQGLREEDIPGRRKWVGKGKRVAAEIMHKESTRKTEQLQWVVANGEA